MSKKEKKISFIKIRLFYVKYDNLVQHFISHCVGSPVNILSSLSLKKLVRLVL